MARNIIDCDVVIQAGHEDTLDNMTEGEGPFGKEIDWTPVVANEAVHLLKAAGVNAVKETAYIKVTHQYYRCKLALFIHFDAPDHGEAGPSVGLNWELPDSTLFYNLTSFPPDPPPGFRATQVKTVRQPSLERTTPRTRVRDRR